MIFGGYLLNSTKCKPQLYTVNCKLYIEATGGSDKVQINAGVFNKKVQVIRYEITKDLDGFETKTGITVLNAWAQATNISGTELLRSNSDFSEVKTRFLIRTPKTEITKDMMIKFEGNLYNITYVNDYNYDKKYTEIIAESIKK